jgi:hypothetical protein
MTAPSPMRPAALRLAARPEGVCMAEIRRSAESEPKPPAVKNLLKRMCEQGLLFRNRKQFKHARYFLSQELADAYTPPARPPRKRASKAKPAHLKKTPGPKPGSERKGRCGHQAAKLVDPKKNAVSPHWRSLPSKEAPQVITPKGLKPQPLPWSATYSRHQLKPGEAVPRVVDSAQCRPWAMAAAESIAGA